MYRSHTLEIDLFSFVVKRALYVDMSCEIYCEFDLYGSHTGVQCAYTET